MSTHLPILHFNDVYRVTPQTLHGVKGTIDCTQFTWLVDAVRDGWRARQDGKKDGLVLFSGDLFSPSVESTVTRGTHMVPVINTIGPDVALTGNHDFDFGYPHLTTLLGGSNFPWLLSNVIDTNTGKVPERLKEFYITERCGIRIGVIGLVEQEWIGTVSSWPPNFAWKDMKEVGLDLSRRLRDPNGEHRCEFIIALTHSRIPNDITLAKQLYALSPSEQAKQPIANEHGVDILLGGHDHLYFVSKGVTSWLDYDFRKGVLGSEADVGDVLVVKSGTDFRDLSEFTLELEETPEGSVRRRVIKTIQGQKHRIQPGSESCKRLQKILSELLTSVSEKLKEPVCHAVAPIDLRSELIRTDESASGNWFADIIRHAYDDSAALKEAGPTDGVLICAGALRGDTIYGPGEITMGDILEILPFDDPVVVLELDGASLWNALEAGLSTWPAQEGRFPVVGGMRVTWDSRRPPNQRLISVQQEVRPDDVGGEVSPTEVTLVDIPREASGKKYKIMTRDYMAEGHDGYVDLKGKRYIVDEEHGQIMSSIVRTYLLGARYIRKVAESGPNAVCTCHIHEETDGLINQWHKEDCKPTKPVDSGTSEATSGSGRRRPRRQRSIGYYQAPHSIANREHMTPVDEFSIPGAYSEEPKGDEPTATASKDKHLPIVRPIVDGRFKDVGRVASL